MNTIKGVFSPAALEHAERTEKSRFFNPSASSANSAREWVLALDDIASGAYRGIEHVYLGDFSIITVDSL